VDLVHLTVDASQVATGFVKPIGIVNAGDGSGRLFVVGQGGVVRVLRGGVVQPLPYLDLTSWIEGGFERGLESIVFAPTFATTRRLYVYYTAPGGYDVLERLTLSSATTDTPSIAKRTVLLKIKKSTPWHHGGGMAFGPDGYLYIGIGDGGPMGDPRKHAQNTKILLGKILRIDPGDRPGTAPYEGTYKIPKSNPFYKKKNFRKEIWAYGLRNPWRLSFDSATGDLWIGDVGQDMWEEVDFQKAGKGGQNYGWPYWEGTHHYAKLPKGAKRSSFTFPLLDYRHPGGEAVMGGYVYRGTASPALYGTYLYGDWVRGWIGAIRRFSPSGGVLPGGPQRAYVRRTTGMVSSLGVDEAKELYYCDYVTGVLYRFTGAAK
jgi:glucose/arabinose dehydrogenase